MATRFFCSACGTQLEIDDALVGSKVRCGNCGIETRAPAAQLSMPGAAAPSPRPVESAAAPPTPQNPIAAQAAATRPAARPTEDEDYKLVDDDLPASPGAHAARPAQGVPVGKMIQSAGASPGQPAQTPHGLPVGKAIGPAASAPAKQPAHQQAKSAPAEVAKPKSAAQSPVVGKPVGAAKSSGTARRSLPSGTKVPSQPAAPAEPTSPPESTIDDLAQATLPDPGDLVEWDQSRASAPRCERCLTVLSRDSTVCPSCGYDAAVPPPVLEELPADLAIPIVRKGRKSGRASGGPVPLGLYAGSAAQLLVLVAVVLQLLGTLSGEPFSVETPSTLALAAAGFAGVGFLCTSVASVLSLLAPKQSRMQRTIYLKSGCDVVAIALVVGFLRQQAPWVVLLPASALEVAAVLLMLLFMKYLAAQLGDFVLAERAQRLLWKTAALAGGVGLVYGFSALVGSDTFLAARIVGIIVWAYLLFHFTLIVQELAPAATTKKNPVGEK